jgi:hypothetical protein
MTGIVASDRGQNVRPGCSCGEIVSSMELRSRERWKSPVCRPAVSRRFHFYGQPIIDVVCRQLEMTDRTEGAPAMLEVRAATAIPATGRGLGVPQRQAGPVRSDITSCVTDVAQQVFTYC